MKIEITKLANIKFANCSANKKDWYILYYIASNKITNINKQNLLTVENPAHFEKLNYLKTHQILLYLIVCFAYMQI